MGGYHFCHRCPFYIRCYLLDIVLIFWLIMYQYMFCFVFVTPVLINVSLFILDAAQEYIIHTYTILLCV
jgi:hypothetical protein